MARFSGFGSLAVSLAIGVAIAGGTAAYLMNRFPAASPPARTPAATAPAATAAGSGTAGTASSPAPASSQPPASSRPPESSQPPGPAPAAGSLPAPSGGRDVTPAAPAAAGGGPVAAGAPPAGTPSAPQHLSRVIVEDAGHLRAGPGTGRRIALAGIAAPAAGETCTAADGSRWPCGARARTALRNLIRMRPLDCTAVTAADGGTAMACRIAPRAGEDGPGGPDLALWLVGNGWARAVSAELSAHEDEARRAGRGLWADADEPLSDIAADAAALPGSGSDSSRGGDEPGTAASAGALVPPAPPTEPEPAVVAPYPAAPPPVGAPATGEPLRLPSAPPAAQ